MRDEDDEPTAVQQTSRDFALKATAQDLRQVLERLPSDDEAPHSSPREHDLRAMLKQLQKERIAGANSRYKRMVTLKTGEDPETDEAFAGVRERALEEQRGSVDTSQKSDVADKKRKSRGHERRSASFWPTAVALLVFGGAVMWTGVLLGRWLARDGGAPAGALLTWRVRPAGATVSVNGVAKPAEGSESFACAGRLSVRVEAPGHRSETHHIPCDGSAVLHIDLDRAEP